jgi:hypothetical protein
MVGGCPWLFPGFPEEIAALLPSYRRVCYPPLDKASSPYLKHFYSRLEILKLMLSQFPRSRFELREP